MLHYETLLLIKMEYPSVIRLMCCSLLFPLSSQSPPEPLLCVNNECLLPESNSFNQSMGI